MLFQFACFLSPILKIHTTDSHNIDFFLYVEDVFGCGPVTRIKMSPRLTVGCWGKFTTLSRVWQIVHLEEWKAKNSISWCSRRFCYIFELCEEGTSSSVCVWMDVGVGWGMGERGSQSPCVVFLDKNEENSSISAWVCQLNSWPSLPPPFTSTYLVRFARSKINYLHNILIKNFTAQVLVNSYFSMCKT